MRQQAGGIAGAGKTCGWAHRMLAGTGTSEGGLTRPWAGKTLGRVGQTDLSCGCEAGGHEAGGCVGHGWGTQDASVGGPDTSLGQ